MPYKDPEKQKEYLIRHYRDNKGAYAKSTALARERRKQRVIQLKNQPCTDCGVTYPHYVMEWDHVEDNKIMAVSTMLACRSWKAILEEIAKCELVCANCHADRTYQRANAGKYDYSAPEEDIV